MFILFLVGCKKDKKVTIPPTITYSSPSGGQALSYIYDAITHKYHLPINVVARVTDPVHLASIMVSLTDLNHTPLQAPVSVPITSADFVFNIMYDVTDFRLQGSYLIQITADDGTSASSSFQPITIIESPTLWTGYCVNAKSNPLNIARYDSLQNQSFLSVTLTNFNGMKFSGYNQQLFINGSGASQSFQAFNLNHNMQDYADGLPGGQTDYTLIYTDGNKSYVGFSSVHPDSTGIINSYLSSGLASTSYRYRATNTAYPYRFIATSTNNVAIYKVALPNNQDVLVNFGQFGFPVTTVALPVKINVVSVLQKSVDSLYIFGNDSNQQATAYIYTFSGGISASPLSGVGSLGKLLSAVSINNEYVILSTKNGVYACTGTAINTTAVLPAAQKLAYQPKLNVLVAASGLNLNAYKIVTNAGITSFNPFTKMNLTFADSIVDFEVITNK
ncbi:MAG: hypothetical protein ABI388_06215 [Bacteroidia bacterium]